MPDSSSDSAPVFTVLVSCCNEERRIRAAVESLLDPLFRAQGEMLILDGGSTDKTREIVEGIIADGWNIRLIPNPGRLQSAGLNIGLREARGRFIIRADAHSVYPPDYVRRCLELLARPEVACAGGVMSPVGETPVQKAIARAMRHPVGVGDAKYHLGNHQGYYEGVYLGAYKREIFARVGGYDPTVHPNEDADLNMRIVESGAKIWLDGTLRVDYFPRDSFRQLFVQYFKYGRGRCRTTLKHRRFTSWRQVLPPLLVASFVAAFVAAAVHPLFLLWPVLYLSGVAVSAAFGSFESPVGLPARVLVFVAFVVMHVAWGAGFWSGLPAPRKRPAPEN
jgi:succinoglycan biosynthesis protein ExoA